jgi:hypothetical protein
MKAPTISLVAALIVVCGPPTTNAATNGSRYLKLTRNRDVEKQTALLRTTVTLKHPDSVYLQTDGTYSPQSARSAADVFLVVDGNKVSNDSLTDWRAGERGDAHPFDALAALSLAPGRHVIEVRASSPRLPACVVAAIEDCSRQAGGNTTTGGFRVLAGANLSVVVHPAAHVVTQRLATDSGPFDFDTTGYFTTDTHLTKPLPLTPLLSSTVTPGEPAVALGSGWLYPTGLSGDAMLAMLLDGNFPGDNIASWGNTDLCICADLRAPVSVQEFVAPAGEPQQVALGTIEFPWMPTWVPAYPEDPVVYWVAAGTTMSVLSGGFTIVGVAGGPADISPDPPPALVGGALEGVPTGTNIELASSDVNVPPRSGGVVFFSAKALDQGGGGFDGPPYRGTISLWLTIDGKQAGPRARQQVNTVDAGSGRTISTSYLAAGKTRLKPGTHHVRVWGRADGPFRQAWMWPNAALIWFD